MSLKKLRRRQLRELQKSQGRQKSAMPPAYDMQPGEIPAIVGTGPHHQAILDQLRQVCAISGYKPAEVFSDWVDWTCYVLAALPEQIKTSVVLPGSTSSHVVQLRNHVQSRYGSAVSGSYTHNKSVQVWNCFYVATQVLIDCARLTIWGHLDSPYYLGPDVIGEIEMAFSRDDRDWIVPCYYPWKKLLSPEYIKQNLLRVLMQEDDHMVLGEPDPDFILRGADYLYTALREACEHPDNLQGQAALQEEPPHEDRVRLTEWFFDRFIPAAVQPNSQGEAFFRPLRLKDNHACTGARVLAMASMYPIWAIHLNLVQIVPEQQPFYNGPWTIVYEKIAAINSMLYGLGGYYLNLMEAAHPDTPRIEGSADEALRLGFEGFALGRPPQAPVVNLKQTFAPPQTFEEMFRGSLSEMNFTTQPMGG